MPSLSNCRGNILLSFIGLYLKFAILEKNELKPWLKEEWCIPKVGAEFVWRMEDLLDLYMQPYDEAFPVVCIDERPCQLIGHLQPPEPPQPGRLAREDTEFSRHGACSTFLMFEPQAGWRHALVKATRQTARFCRLSQILAR